jgi:ABC-type Fe3+-siderophore transport system permease subunit
MAPAADSQPLRLVLVLAGLAAAATAAALAVVALGPAGVDPLRALALLVAPDGSPDADLVRSVRLPRAAAGLLAGAALAASGALLQAVARNPLAEPGTLGVGAGAWLGVTLAGVAGVSLGGLASVPFALAGGLVAALLALGVAGGLHADPVRWVLAGVAIALACSAGVAALQVLFEQRTAGVFLFGAGSVEQPGWAPVRALAGAVPVLLTAAWWLARDLDALDLGDDAAAGLGVAPGRARLLAGLTAIALAAVGVSLAGPISFVGLAAPHLARRLGLLGPRMTIPAATVAGAALLPSADAVALAIGGEEVPAGVICTALGAPLLVAIARRAPVRAAAVATRARRSRRGWHPGPLAGTAIAVVLVLVALVAALGVGEVGLGPVEVLRGLLGRGDAALIVRELRLPRALVAATAGAVLAVCGTVLQGTARNPLAGPELIGVTGGAALGAVSLLVLAQPSAVVLALGAFTGGMLALGAVVALAPRELDPQRVALIGVAVAGATLAVVHVLLLRAGPRITDGVVFLAGSTYAEGWRDLAALAPVLVGGTALAWLAGRRLDALGAGDDVAIGLGVAPARTRAALLVLSATLAAAAVTAVGAVGFVGLMAPHAARLLVGAGHRRTIPVAALLGAGLLLVADLVGRSALDASREIPSGIVTALIGAPLLLVLLRRRA